MGDNQEGMSFPNAPKFIKFALGENVKQSNWGGNPNRFPQSRSGVEQAFDFWFTRAKEYEKEKNTIKITEKICDWRVFWKLLTISGLLRAIRMFRVRLICS